MPFVHHAIEKLMLAGVLTALAPSFAFAACSGASSPIALQNFIKDPAAWIAANGTAADVGAQIAALAAAATNGKDRSFGAALNTALGAASADQGTAIGTALGGLNNSCTDARDPADPADKQFIAANIAPNMRASASANLAFGEASGPQTATTGGGGGGAGGSGAGVGGQTGGGANGGSFQGGSSAPSGGVPTTPTQFSIGASGSTGIQ